MAAGPVERPKGRKIPRIAGQRPRCEWCPKIPQGVEPIPANAVVLSEKNEAAYRHYLECRAVSEFPKDDIVRRNAMLIQQIEKIAEEYRMDETQQRGIILGLQLMKKA